MNIRRGALCFAIGSGVLAIGLSACGDDTSFASPDAAADTAIAVDSALPETDAAEAAPATQPVTVAFRAVVGSEAFSCGKTYAGLGTANTSVKPGDFRFYVHDVALTKADGTGSVPVTLTKDGKWQLENLALLDFEDQSGECTDGTPDLNAEVKGNVPVGQYRGLTFKVGVPFAQNHGNQATAPSPLTLTQLFWDWQSGYKFAKIDMLPQPANPGDPALIRWNFHLGSTGCDGDPGDGGTVTSCAHPNVLALSFDAFDPAAQVVQLDYKALVSGTDLTVNPAPVPGCMSQGLDLGTQCPAMFARLGVSMDTGLPVAGQTAFSVQAR